MDEQENKFEQVEDVVREEMEKIQNRSILLGAQVACRVILDKINVAMNQPGKRSMNDYKRLVKDIQQFCETGVSRKVNADGTTEETNKSKSETVQN